MITSLIIILFLPGLWVIYWFLGKHHQAFQFGSISDSTSFEWGKK